MGFMGRDIIAIAITGVMTIGTTTIDGMLNAPVSIGTIAVQNRDETITAQDRRALAVPRYTFPPTAIWVAPAGRINN